jgi:small subunit ribosomal protein S18
MYKNKVKKRISPISLDQKINYKDINLLKTFINDQGQILPRYMTKLIVK